MENIYSFHLIHSLRETSTMNSNRTIEFVFGFEATIAAQLCMQIHPIFIIV